MDKFLKSMLEAFEREDINPEDEFRDYEEWDSMAYLSIIAMIDENYDIVIPGDEFSKLNKVIDIYNYINGNRQN